MFGWLTRLFAGAPPASPAAVRSAVRVEPSVPSAVTIPAVEAMPAAGTGPAPREAAAAAVGESDRTALLCRTEILDREQHLLGYAFELRDELTGRIRAPGRRARDFVDGLLVEQVAARGQGAALRDREVCLPIWDGFLAQPVIERLAGLQTALLVRPEAPGRRADADTLAHAARLRELGLRIVLDHNDAGPWLESLLPVADGAVFRMGFCAPDEIALFARTVTRLRPGLALWAWEVGTHDDFELARKVGCSAFAGGFVTRREDWKGRSLSPHGLRLASLLERLRRGVETQEIAEILKHDLALAYRLLRYVNAAAWGLNHHITSVEQAIVLLGQQPLQRWVSMMLMGSAREEPGAAVVMEAALVRARFLELLGAHRGERDPAAQLFVLGLFSMLDVALKMPMDEAIRPLKLSEPMQDALLHLRGPMAPYLELALAFERGDAQRIKSFADVLGVDLGELNRLQFEALDWVQAAEA